MKFWNLVLNCIIVGALAMLAGLLVSFLFNLIVHGQALVAWGATFRMAVVIGLVIPIAELIKVKSE